SGDRVEVLDRQGEEAQIQLPNGSSGWVKASYLSAELPLQRRLQDQTAQVEKLKQEVTRLQSQARAAPVPSGGSAPSVRSAPSTGPAPSGGSADAAPAAAAATPATAASPA